MRNCELYLKQRNEKQKKLQEQDKTRLLQSYLSKNTDVVIGNVIYNLLPAFKSKNVCHLSAKLCNLADSFRELT